MDVELFHTAPLHGLNYTFAHTNDKSKLKTYDVDTQVLKIN